MKRDGIERTPRHGTTGPMIFPSSHGTTSKSRIKRICAVNSPGLMSSLFVLATVITMNGEDNHSRAVSTTVVSAGDGWWL